MNQGSEAPGNLIEPRPSRRNRRPQVTRGALFLFITLVILLTAQAGWWIVYQLMESQRTFRMSVEHATQERDYASLRVEMMVRSGASEHEIIRFIREQHPQLELLPAFTPAPRASQDAAITQASRVQIRPEHLTTLEHNVRRRALMFLGEGSFFFGLMLVGVYLIHSTLQREVALKQQQSNFVSAVTHELKSPLASLRLYLQTIQMKRVDPERAERYVSHMLEDVDRLESLVENLLEAAKLETRGGRFHLERLELGEEVETLLNSRRQKLHELEVDLSISLPDDPLEVHGDRQAIRTVLSNLLENALKYTEPPRKIGVRLSRQARWAVLEVQDNGIGLNPEEMTRIFEKFYRVGNELVRREKGTGLGLYLVSGMVKAHGGRVEVRSDGPRRGATFRVWLPLAGPET